MLQATIDGANYNTGVGVDVFAAITSGDEIRQQALLHQMHLHQVNRIQQQEYNTLSTLSTGDYNTAVGRAALNANTGDKNTAVGTNAMLENSSGYENVAVGRNSLDAKYYWIS